MTNQSLMDGTRNKKGSKMTTLHQSRQKFFNKAYNGLKSQDFKQSKMESPDFVGVTFCCYRDGNGLSCAIGHCISDDDYSEFLESRSVDDPDILRRINHQPEDLDFLMELQDCHDLEASRSPHMMKRELECFARNYNLNIPQTEK